MENTDLPDVREFNQDKNPVSLQGLQSLRDSFVGAYTIRDPQERRDFIQNLTMDQVKQKGRFREIFSTESGSIYFVIQSGECLRIKHSMKEEKWSVEGIHTHVFYLDDEQTEAIIADGQKPGWSKRIVQTEIQTREFGVGMTPIDFGTLRDKNIEVRKLDEDRIKLPADMFGDLKVEIHIGNKITKVY